MIKKIVILNLIFFNLNILSATARECLTRKECEDPTNKCKCFCAGVCKYRNKKSTDSFIYIEKDPEKKKCYCKEWDLDNIDECVN